MKKFDNKIDNNFSTPICLSCYHLWVFFGFFFAVLKQKFNQFMRPAPLLF